MDDKDRIFGVPLPREDSDIRTLISKKKEEGVLTMLFSTGLFIIGRLIGGNKLLKPRVFSMYEAQEQNPISLKMEKVNRISMSPLPGTPPFMRVGAEAGSYPMPEKAKEIRELYERVTDKSVDPGE